VLGGLLLILTGFVFALDHTGAAMAYGIPLSGGSDNAWISSIAFRDRAFGCLAVTFAILRDRRAMGLTLLFGALLCGSTSEILCHFCCRIGMLPSRSSFHQWRRRNTHSSRLHLFSLMTPFYRRVSLAMYHSELPGVATRQRKNLVLRLEAHLAFRRRIPTWPGQRKQFSKRNGPLDRVHQNGW
jgi:hypothetical protein